MPTLHRSAYKQHEVNQLLSDLQLVSSANTSFQNTRCLFPVASNLLSYDIIITSWLALLTLPLLPCKHYHSKGC